MAETPKAITNARIPFVYHSLRLQDRFPSLYAYVSSKNYTEDRRTGIGVNIICDDHDRAPALACLAKAAALTGDRVIYTNLTHICEALDERHTEYDTLLATRALFVVGFYDPSVEFAFTSAERRLLEQFMRERVEAGLRNYYSMGHPFKEAAHWSAEFRGVQCQFLREVTI